MITIFSVMDYRGELEKILYLLGNTVVFKKNEYGEWNKMETIRWPILAMAFSLLMTMSPFVTGFGYIMFVQGKLDWILRSEK